MSTEPAAKRPPRGSRSRDDILNAAQRSMALYGYDGTSVARIAEESGLPVTSIYWYFGSKAGVLAAVMERGAERFFAVAEPSAADTDDPRARFHAELRSASRSITEHPDFLRLLLLLTLSGGPDDENAKLAQDLAARGKQRLRSGIVRAYAHHGPEVAERVGDALVDLAQALFDGLFVATQTHGMTDQTAIIDYVADVLLMMGDAVVAGRQLGSTQA